MPANMTKTAKGIWLAIAALATFSASTFLLTNSRYSPQGRAERLGKEMMNESIREAKKRGYETILAASNSVECDFGSCEIFLSIATRLKSQCPSAIQDYWTQTSLISLEPVFSPQFGSRYLPANITWSVKKHRRKLTCGYREHKVAIDESTLNDEMIGIRSVVDEAVATTLLRTYQN